MQVAVRSRLAVGVSLVGASALLISPISPSAPANIQVPAIHSAMVELAASTNPIQQWVDVVGGAVTNVVGIGSAVVSDPAPALRALLNNQLGYAQEVAASLGVLGESLGAWATQVVPAELQNIVTSLSQGNVVGAANAVNYMIATLLGSAFPAASILTIPVRMAESLVRVLAATTNLFTALLPLAVGVVSPVQAFVESLGDQGQALVNAFGAGDPLAALGAIINTPGVLVGAVLNGYTSAYPDEWGYKQYFPGLLSFDPAVPTNSGIFATLLVTLPRIIANALVDPASLQRTATTETTVDGIASLPDLTATTVSLETPIDKVIDAPKTEVDPASNTVETEPGTVKPVVVKPVVVEPVVEPVTVEPVVEKVVVAEETDNVAVTDEDTSTGVDEGEKEKPADPRTDTKDGNKAEPGKVNTGVSNNGSSTTTTPSKTDTETETAVPAEKPKTSTGSGEATGNAGSSDSGSSDSGDGGSE